MAFLVAALLFKLIDAQLNSAAIMWITYDGKGFLFEFFTGMDTKLHVPSDLTRLRF